MTRILWLAILMSLAALAEARVRRPETPHATDLLTAEKMAEQAQRRLKMPAARGSGWQRGGGGWSSSTQAPAEEPGAVRIEIRPSRRR
jgi:hypothetical protein